MKKKLLKKTLTALTLIVLCHGAFAQHSFPTSNAVWNESINGEYSIYGLLGDTIIGGAQYSKLYRSPDTILIEENIELYTYLGAFRNEEQKVWFKPAYCEETANDILLYDFAAEVGDTVWHNRMLLFYDDIYCDDGPDTYSVVFSITTANNRKVYSVHAPAGVNNAWVEGVGCKWGILRSISYFTMDIEPDKYKLNCLKHNDSVVYLNHTCNSCFCNIPTGIKDYKSQELKLSFNSSNTELKVELPEDLKNVAGTINVLDMAGRVLYKNTVNSNALTINISSYKSGIYVVSYNGKQCRLVGRFVKGF